MSLRVLVVEDSPACAESTAMLLRLFGHEALVARDGATALALAAAGPHDVVLLDLGLPDMTGHEVARRLRALLLPRLPLLVAVTSRCQESDHLESRAAGIELHLVKPVDPTRLLQAVEQAPVGLTASPAGPTMPAPPAYRQNTQWHAFWSSMTTATPR
jgi:CheY-like chemotaxis protein